MRLSTSRLLLLLLLLVAACGGVGCGHAPSSGGGASAQLGPRLAERWSYALDASEVGAARVYAASPSCVLLESWQAGQRGEGVGMLRCLDPADGQLIWERGLSTEAPQGASFVVLSGELVVIAQGTRVLGLELESGEERWSLETGARLVRGAALLEGLLLVDLNHEVLALVEVEGGVWRGGLALEGRALEFAQRDASGGLVVLSGAGEKAGEARVGAASLEVPEQPPSSPWTPLALLWERRTTLAGWSAEPVGDAVVAHLEGERLEVLDPRTGEVLQEEAVPALAAQGQQGRGGRWVRVGQSADPYASLEEELRPRELPRGALPVLIAGSELIVQAPEPGLMLETLVLQGRSPRELRLRWTLSVALPELITRRAELPGSRAFVLASRRHLLFLDAGTGRLLHHTRLSKRRAGWRDIATDGRAIYLLFTRGKEPRLEAWPR